MARFLYIEDYEDLRKKIVASLKKSFPADVFLTAVDYNSAIAAIDRDGPFTGIISDWHYPGKPTGRSLHLTSGGYDFLLYMQDNKISTPVAIVTLYTDTDLEFAIKQKGLEMPAGGFCTKSIESFHVIIESFKSMEKKKAPELQNSSEAQAALK